MSQYRTENSDDLT
ncbi:hypothetical protein ECEC1870_2683, partial [Escherichia coli EC1870]